ncbi:MAG: hypothetical protein ACTSRS_11915 [Candidatus Helarchaeota archaeon]
MSKRIIPISRKTANVLQALKRIENDLIINLPVTQRLFDQLTLLDPTVWEILIPSKNVQKFLKFQNMFHLITLSNMQTKLCTESKIEVFLSSNKLSIPAFSLPPELALILTIRDPTIPRVFIALGILQHCDLERLERISKYFSPPETKMVHFLCELATIRLYRVDQIWDLIVKYKYRDYFSRFSLYVRDFIKNEFIYKKPL